MMLKSHFVQIMSFRYVTENVYKMRYLGVTISGLLGDIGGLAFTVAAGFGFQSQVAWVYRRAPASSGLRGLLHMDLFDPATANPNYLVRQNTCLPLPEAA